ncbi:MAG: Lipid carrier : UDP-N-acetylgalactosaminyltransferase (EC / Alpha-1,3-N-acetylgalactosamine transferase PglA (EC; Putative glycosyltransferase [uncultured Caballeronia sp.]|nr:MAG: Lipid carrier : UDP-N-acetylgalactosaminyltransferase (EC / Alpha-1,3-N-acetylgalactosamine transferase PglA (EC; Putative glycosyltransferase [uncultured Caballeronia sp.]
MNAEKSRLRIALVCNTAWAIYTYRRGLLRMLIEHGVEVSVIAPRDRTFAPLEEMGCRCVELPVASKGTNPGDDLKTLAALYREYRATQPHMVFHYTIKPNIYGSIAAKLAGIPSIAVTTGLGYVFIQKSRTASVAKRLYRFAFRFPREVWFLNQDDRQAFIDQNLLVHPDRARLLHGEGVDLDDYAFQPLPRANPQTEGFFFILIGRLLWDKGVAEYVNAARRLRLTYPYAWFQLLGPVGVDNPSAITLDEVQAWQREGVIDYLGEAHDVRAFIGNADCVVLPSYREGVPRTLMEASAMGRPIVATDVPGCREVVENGVTGLLCEVKSADSLAQQLERLLLSSHMARAEMGVAGRAKVAREFDENAIIEDYKGTIRAVTGVSL